MPRIRACNQYDQLCSKIDGKAYDEALSLVVTGAASLLRHGKALEALDLSDMMLKDLLTLNAQPLKDAYVSAALEIVKGIPAGVAVNQTVAFLRGMIRWAKAAVEKAAGSSSSGKSNSSSTSTSSDGLKGEEAEAAIARLHDAAARTCVGGGAEFYPDAQRHFLEARNPAGFASFLADWATSGYANERDLFLARAVLQLLCLGEFWRYTFYKGYSRCYCQRL